MQSAYVWIKSCAFLGMSAWQKNGYAKEFKLMFTSTLTVAQKMLLRLFNKFCRPICVFCNVAATSNIFFGAIMLHKIAGPKVGVSRWDSMLSGLMELGGRVTKGVARQRGRLEPQMLFAPARHKTAPHIHLGLHFSEWKRVCICVLIQSGMSAEVLRSRCLSVCHWRSRSSRYLYSNVNPSFFLWPHFS